MATSNSSLQNDAAKHWERHLAGLGPCHFPSFKADGPVSKRPMTVKVNLEHLAELQKLSSTDEAALPGILRAVWALVLRCYTGSEDVCFGYDESQPRMAATSLQGISVARLAVDGATTLAELVKKAKAEYTTSLPYHGHTTSGAIAACGDRKLFNTMLMVRSYGNPSLTNGSTITLRPLNTALPDDCKIRVLIKRLSGGVSIFLEWWSSFMPMEQALGIGIAFDKALTSLIVRPDLAVGDLDLFTDYHKQQVMKCNVSSLNTVDRLVHEIIDDQVAIRPDSQAVCAWDGEFTFKTLDEASSKLAQHLAKLGVGPEVHVALCFDKSRWNVVAMLGVLKAGGAFVPLDPSHPITRLQGLARTVEASILLCSRQHVNKLSTAAETIVPVDSEFIDGLPQASNSLMSEVKSNNAAYILFTSGSTGEPKGSIIEHGALCTSSLAHGPRMLISADSRVLQFAAHTFDISLSESLTPLMLGGCVCIPSEESRMNNIVGMMNDLRVNVAILTPSFINFIEPSAVPELKTLVLAGEAMSQAHVDTWSKINLVNGYGPSEVAIFSIVNSRVTAESDPRDIGLPVGVHAWVVDAGDHNRLVPPGSSGELLLEGPLLARGYLRDPVKTADSFIYDPLWSLDGSSNSPPRRFYKTGDLVRTNSTAGSLSYIGRKDTQVKLHGHRVELGEIEHHLNAHPHIKHGVVLLPKTGPCAGRLVSILSLSDSLTCGDVPEPRNLLLLESRLKDTCVTEISETLSNNLPAYMVPTIWACVAAMPFLTSGKLDRKTVTNWVNGMSSELYQQITGAQGSEDGEIPQSETENKLRSIWSHILNLPLERVGLSHSFLGLGGDSITAMLCMGQCKKAGIGLTVQQILRSKSIKELATHTKTVSRPTEYRETIEEHFDLTPIQQLHFQVREEGQGHFNQNFYLRATKAIRENDLCRAVETIVDRHPMLRSRFSKVNGKWQQRITKSITSSYRLRSHNIFSEEQATPAITDSNTHINAINGPLFTVDVFNLAKGHQLVSMVGHHLVIDLVSWRVILEELEELLLNPTKSELPEKTLPFPIWARLQADQCQDLSLKSIYPLEDVPRGDFSYWGMENQPNNYGDSAREGFEMDAATTSLLLTECHKTFRTDTVDILLSALLYSFKQAFTDRAVPAIYNENHGREPWDSSIDISRTVGWFTTMYPVFVPVSAADSVAEVTKKVKDLRRQVSDNGRPYFAKRFLTKDGKEQFSQHFPMELMLNYLGQYQQLERTDALLQPVGEVAGEAHATEEISDFGRDTPRFGLFEISAVVVQGKLRFSFTFNRFMKHQKAIRNWVLQCQRTLCDVANEFVGMRPAMTLSDFPLLSLTYDSLQTMIEKKLPDMGLADITEVESAYACSPMQQGLLISRTKDDAFYAAHVTYEVLSQTSEPVIANQLAAAWRQVVARHPALRTIFAEGLSGDSSYDQIVLKTAPTTEAVRIACNGDHEVVSAFERLEPVSLDSPTPPHRFTVCQTSGGKVFCRLEISHAVMDGESMSIIFRDLALAYANRLREGEGPLYSEYVEFLRKQNLPLGIAYWTAYLKDVEPCYFPVLNDGIGSEKHLRVLRLQYKELPALESFCNSNGVTLSNALLAAWGMILRCYTGSEETCFGYLSSARDAAVDGIDAAVGPFINMLVCRLGIHGDATLGNILEQVQKDYMGSLPHKHTSLAEVQHALRLPGIALFNTCLSFRKLSPSVRSEQMAIKFSEHAPMHDPTEYCISINVEASDEEIAIDLDYWTDSISDNQAANIANTFMKALDNIVHHSDIPIRDLDNTSARDHGQIRTWNQSVPESIDECVHNVFERYAAAQPEARALCGWDGNFTYKELDDHSARLAHYLVGFGVVPESLVPICFDKSVWTIVSMLAVLKAGGACVPLDASHPKSSLETRVVDTGAQLVLASPERAAVFEDIVPYVISVNSQLLSDLPEYPSISPCTTVRPDNASFVVFTSGSTGKPKGVILEHKSIVTSSDAHGTAIGVDCNTRFLQFAAYTFDNSIEEIFTTLMRGGCVCVPSESQRFNSLAEAINDMEINFMDLTPTVAALLKPSDVPSVKSIAVGGEAMTKKVLDTWSKSIPVHNLYGPSECSINCTHNPHPGSTDDVSNLGRSIGSVSWLVDPADHNRLVPVGAIGELVVEGPILARGYLNDQEKTSKSFIENPEWVMSGPHSYPASTGIKRRMYKTGDLVRYNSDGTLSYLGRKDTQIKLNGQRIELGEIEHHVKANLPSNAQSAVQLVSSGRHKALAAFVCLQQGDADMSRESTVLPMSVSFQSIARSLETAVSTVIPVYMVPSMYIPVSKMPLTSSGKLDRRTLVTLAQSMTEDEASTYRSGGKGGRAPSTELEKFLQQLWASVLSIPLENIGADDSFFRHGGDSIVAMRLVRAAQSHGLNLTVATIFSKPTLSGIAAYIEGATKAISLSSLCAASQPISPRNDVEPFSLLPKTASLDDLVQEVASLCNVEIEDIQDVYPCTAIQEGLIALTSKKPGAYVAQQTYRLPPSIDVTKFKKAWEAVSQAEAILRTRIVFTEDLGFLQVVVHDPIEWHSADKLKSISEAERRLPSQHGGRLSRYTIVGEDTPAPYFVWTVHHALYDGWSLPLMLARVEKCYRDSTFVGPNPAPSFSTFIEYLSSISTEESDNFWRNRLAEPTPPFPELPEPSYQPEATSHLSDEALIPTITNTETTIASVIRAAWAIVASTYSSSNDVIFGEIVTGRDAPVRGIEEIAGPTLATLPTRIRIVRDLSVSSYLKDVQKQLAEAMPYQFAGLQQIKRLGPHPTLACDFQTLLAINYEEDVNDEFWDLVSHGTSGTNFYTYPLNISCTVSHGKVSIDVHYDKVVMSTCAAERILDQFTTTLTRLASAEWLDDKIGDIDIISPRDLQTVTDLNRNPLQKMDRCIHQAIQDYALSCPKSAAICAYDGTFTHKNLDELSTALAHHLIDLGVGRESEAFVALFFEKSAFAIISMLAVLKAGCAFVPLDAEDQVSNLQRVISSMRVSLALCSPRYQMACECILPQVLPVDLASLQNLPIPPRLLPTFSPNSPAYMIFDRDESNTSGGIIVEHANFCTAFAGAGTSLSIGSGSRVLQFAPYTSNTSSLEILATLMMGGCVCVPRDASSVANISGFINEMNVDTAVLPPSFARLIQASAVPNLRTLILTGEMPSQAHLLTWAGRVNIINAYVSGQCPVAVFAKTLGTESNPANIGRSSSHCWIVDPYNHHRLAPVGTVGEMVVEGPIHARRYFGDDQEADSIVVEPKWACNSSSSGAFSRAMYKTGDMVRYNSSYEMIFLGTKRSRADTWERRLLLNKIENHLRSDIVIQQALVTIPSSGPNATKLVALLSLQELPTSAGDLHVVTSKDATSKISGIRDRLRSRVPAYMMPSKWIILCNLPLLSSGKLDRRRILEFIEGSGGKPQRPVPKGTASSSWPGISTKVETSSALNVEEELRKTWSHILGLDLEEVDLDTSFLHLGGDSISAMRVMARCRTRGLAVTVQDIIQSKSIPDLAARVKVAGKTSFEAEDEKLFDLSPIQQVYMQCVGEKWAQFNQSIHMRLPTEFGPSAITRAMDALTNAHSMLRARFQRDATGIWRQRMTKDGPGSYRFRMHNNALPSQVQPMIEDSQKCLDIINGPVCAVDLFDFGGSESQISIVAHHLVIDVVSWRVIVEDLETLLGGGTLKTRSSLPFQTWCRLQLENAQRDNAKAVIPSVGIPAANTTYWGMGGRPNLYGDVIHNDVDLDPAVTRQLLEWSLDSQNSDIVDILLAAILLSFGRQFSDRDTPAIFNEGHGREPWDTSLDLSSTVGWFTTLSPVCLPGGGNAHDLDFVTAIQWIRDFRSRMPGKGRSYFAYRVLTEDGRRRFGQHWPMEITFNYLGQHQPSERNVGLLQPVNGVSGPSLNTTSDIGPHVSRIALIEVSAVVIDGTLQLSFDYNKFMAHRSDIENWVRGCKKMLEEAQWSSTGPVVNEETSQLSAAFPLLPLTYGSNAELAKQLSSMGLSSLSQLEDAYPCTPMQRGIILAQLKDPEKYSFQSTFEVRPRNSINRVDPGRLEEAWIMVVKRHTSLRTVFIESVSGGGLMDQAVLKEFHPNIRRLQSTAENASHLLATMEPFTYNYKEPPHRFTICDTPSGQVFCKLELNHSICDGFSMPLIFRDLNLAYEGHISANEAGPAYSNFIAYLQSTPNEAGVNYWKTYLAGVEPCLLPSLADNSRPKTRRLGTHVREMDKTRRLQAFCKKEGVTPASALQLVWGLVLRSYTGSSDVCFGYVSSGRDIPVDGVQEAVGAFINMLICRLDLSGNLCVGEVLKQAQGDFIDSMQHQSCSLAEVQHALGLSDASLFNTVFTFQKRTGMADVEESSILFDVIDAADPNEYNMSINIEALDSHLEVDFDYWTDAVSDAQAENIANTFEHILNTLIRSQGISHQKVVDLDLFDGQSCRQVLKWNNKLPQAVNKCVHEIIEEQTTLHRRYTSVAVCAWDASLTYEDLENLANRLANHLTGLGVMAEVYVPLCFDKSAWTIVAQLAVLKAGGAFVSLDPSHPDNRLRGLIEEVGANLVLCSPQHQEKISRVAKMTVTVDQSSISRLPNRPPNPSSARPAPSNPAYVIFTSGTTGKPKGTVLEHGAICTGAVAHTEALQMNSTSRVLQFASYSFDASILEILSALIVGACVCVPNEEDRMGNLPKAIADMNVNWALLTPSVAATLDPESVPSLKTLVTGGEAMSAEHIEKWKGGPALFNAYGPTETSVVASVSMKVNQNGYLLDGDRFSIGTAVGGRAWIVDPHNVNRLMPIGAIGELVMEGPTLARGYLNNIQKTEEVFINHTAWMEDPGLRHAFSPPHRIYRTGDLVRYNADGSLCYLSRKDTQIKLNGQRIEVGEIEYHCKINLPDKTQVAIELVTRRNSKFIALFFALPSNDISRLPESNGTCKSDLHLPMTEVVRSMAKDLEITLASSLPSYMIPRLFVPVVQMPFVASGKLDRRRLREIVQNLSNESVKMYRLATPPNKRQLATGIQSNLQALWEKVLNLAPGSVGVDDSFFRLGGDSLSAMDLVGAARAEGIAISVVNIFRHPVLRDMASICSSSVNQNAKPAPKAFDLVQGLGPLEALMYDISMNCRVDPQLVQDIYPASPLQEGLVTLSIKQPGAYVAKNVFRLSPSVDIMKFKAAWQKVMNDLDTLRTRIFHTDNSQFLQVVLNGEAIVWHSARSLEDIPDDASHLPQHNGGPLTRYTIVGEHCSDNRYFVWTIHHSLYDGFSLPRILERVEKAYSDDTSNRPDISYASFIQYLLSSDVQSSENYWRSALSDVSFTNFPQIPASLQSQVSETRVARSQCQIPQGRITTDVTIPSTVRAAWALVVASHTGSNDVCFGETLTGRNIDVVGVENIVGPMLTTVPMRVGVNWGETVMRYLDSVNRMAIDMIPHQHLGLQHIRRLNSDTSNACEFQNLLVIQTTQQKNENSLWSLQSSGDLKNFFTYPLVMECSISGAEIETVAYYKESVISTWQVQRLLAQFNFVVTQITAASNDGKKTLKDIRVFSPEDRETVISWNREKNDASVTWVLDPTDPDRLAPLGAPGELALEELTLARGYLSSSEENADAFVEDLLWAKDFPTLSSSPRRIIHKTGDLVKYKPDGTLEFIGRKDSLVKINGQRVKLGDIQQRLEANHCISQAAVLIPKSGLLAKRLVVVLSLNNIVDHSSSLEAGEISPVYDGRLMDIARPQLVQARNWLLDQLPSYMLPQVWIFVKSVPLLSSGKPDSKHVHSWLENVDGETYKRIMALDKTSSDGTEITGAAKVIRQVFSTVLNVSLESIKMHDSFLALGGDSITAMSVLSRCRKEGINLLMHDVLRSKSITQLAQVATAAVTMCNDEEKIDEPFSLSPVQRMYFEFAEDHQGASRFNQSMALQISRHVEADTLRHALETIISRHSMLRARFSKGQDGVWQQRITQDVDTSYRYREHHVNSVHDAAPFVANTQISLDIEHGPMFAADLFNVKGNKQMLFLVSHHLCVDVVSWSIILQGLEELLVSGSLPVEKPLSFQTWCAMQAENEGRQATLNPLPFSVGPSNLGYWEMEGQANTYGNVDCEMFEIDETTTALALSECHKPLQTEPLDLFIAAVSHSFGAIFTDRGVPTLYNEGHGREPCDSSIDPSRTVGWFTTICPITVESRLDVLHTIREVKDVRRRIPQNGRQYFARRFLSSGHSSPSMELNSSMEILFNYLGRMRQAERDGSLLQQVDFAFSEEDVHMTDDVGRDMNRFALFEISALVSENKLQFSFLFNRQMKHAHNIRRWVSECKSTLEEMVQSLMRTSPEPTLSDYPLLPINYDGLRKLVKVTFPKAGVSSRDQVEDIYPCSPTQEGILLGQLRDPATYLFNTIFEVKRKLSGYPVDAGLIGKAWQQVVDRHPALRTVFVDSVYPGGTFDQLVVKSVDSGVIFIRCDDSDAVTKLKAIRIQDTSFKKRPRLPHQLTICTTSSGRVLVKAEINHAIIDGGSTSIIFNDLAAAYESRLPRGSGPLYSEYIRFIRSQSNDDDINYWMGYLKGIQPCHLPRLGSQRGAERVLLSIPMKFDRFPELQALSEKTGATMANVVHAAWALVLRQYTGSDDVCFGYLSAGRDAPVDGIQHAVGAFINMLCCRVKFTSHSTLTDVIRKVQDDHFGSLPFQTCSLAQVQHQLGLVGKPLYNTALSINNHSRSSDAAEEEIIYETLTAHDPSEYMVTLNVETARNDEGVVLRYWSDLISHSEAKRLASSMAQALTAFIDVPGQIIAQCAQFMDKPLASLNQGCRQTEPPINSEQSPSMANSQGKATPVSMADPNQTTHKQLVNEFDLQNIVELCVQNVIDQISQSGISINSNVQERVNDLVQRKVAELPSGNKILRDDGHKGTKNKMKHTQTERSLERTRSKLFQRECRESRLSEPWEDNNYCPKKDKDIQSMASHIKRRGRSAHAEKKLLMLWSSILELDEDTISGEDSFFELGGDSITAMRLVGAAREEGLALTVADVFRNPVFEDMMAIIRVASMMSNYIENHDDYNAQSQAIRSAATSELYQRFSLVKASNIDSFLQSNICPKVGVFKGGIADVLPVTDFQGLAITGSLLESRWMLNYFFLDGRGALDLRKFKLSCFRVVQAIDILRTVFLPCGDRFLQVVLRKLRPDFSVYDTEMELDEFTAMLQRRDRENGPKLGEPFTQFTVVRRKGTDHHRIVIRISHAQYDGVCLPKIFSALQAAYQGDALPSTSSFAGYVRGAAETMTSDHYNHWKKFLDGSEMTEIVQRAGPNYRRSAGATAVLKQTILLPSIAHGNITTATLIKAAWALVLAQLAGKSDIVFGHTISGRNATISGVENTVGPCINIVPVRVKFDENWTALDLLRYVQNQQVSNMPFEALGFREITKHCTEWPDWANFTTVVQHQNIDRDSEIAFGENVYKFGGVGTDEDFADFTIVSTPQASDQCEISLGYSLNGAITPVFAQKVLNMLCNTAANFMADPKTRLPSPQTLSRLQPQTVQDNASTSDKYFLSAQLEGVSRAEMLVLSDIVTRSWRQVLGEENCRKLQLETSFFDLNGDIMGLAQVAWLLEQEGFKVPIEDLIDHPTMVGQIAVICSQNSPRKTQVSTSPSTSSLNEDEEPAPRQKFTKTNSWVKAMGVAKRIVRRNTRPSRTFV